MIYFLLSVKNPGTKSFLQKLSQVFSDICRTGDIWDCILNKWWDLIILLKTYPEKWKPNECFWKCLVVWSGNKNWNSIHVQVQCNYFTLQQYVERFLPEGCSVIVFFSIWLWHAAYIFIFICMYLSFIQLENNRRLLWILIQ